MAAAGRTKPRLAPPDTDGGERRAHIVEGKDKVTRAYVLGEPIVALCGKKWVPSRDPDGLPICPACVEALHRRRARSA
jgi:hypothetical protein